MVTRRDLASLGEEWQRSYDRVESATIAHNNASNQSISLGEALQLRRAKESAEADYKSSFTKWYYYAYPGLVAFLRECTSQAVLQGFDIVMLERAVHNWGYDSAVKSLQEFSTFVKPDSRSLLMRASPKVKLSEYYEGGATFNENGRIAWGSASSELKSSLRYSFFNDADLGRFLNEDIQPAKLGLLQHSLTFLHRHGSDQNATAACLCLFAPKM